MENPAATAAPATRPVRILASYSWDAPNVDQAYADELHGLAHSAGRMLSEVNDRVQVVYVDSTHAPQSAEALVPGFDGVLILGGADVSAEFYGGDDEAVRHTKGNVPDADRFEIALVHAARAAGIPLLGICRGMQVINVALGGTLIPDLGDAAVHNDFPRNELMTDHEVAIVPDSTLAETLGATRIPIRSAHHQAVAELADDLVVAATADDGVIEAVEAPSGCWTVAVQWHPEDPGARAKDFAALATAFIQAAERR